MTIIKLKKCINFKNCSHYVKDEQKEYMKQLEELEKLKDKSNYCVDCQKILFGKPKRQTTGKLKVFDIFWKHRKEQRRLI